MIIGLQIIAILFSFSLIYFAVLHYRRGELDTSELLSWVLIWVATIFVVIFPNLLRDFATQFFITRLFDLMVVAGFIVVISTVYLAYVKVRRMEKKLDEYVRKEALKPLKKKSSK